jgi:segregation and condensation protein A
VSTATQAALPNAGVNLANVDVINHLLFHKALVDDTQDNSRINNYIAMAKDGEHVSLKDPFDRSIALAFDLVIQGQLNVWDVDLVRFSEMYLKRAREENIDLVTAGRIILMAWTVLKHQSDDLVRKFEARQLEVEEQPWDQIDPAWQMPGDDFDFTNRVLGMRHPIDEKIWHEGDRPVTLMELVNAFEQARDEAETRLRLNDERDKMRSFLKAEGMSRFQGRVHKEDLEEDIKLIWDRICGLNGGAIPLAQLYDKSDVWDFVTAFNSVLFLHRDRRIELWQENFPYGPVQVKNLKLGTQDEPAGTSADTETIAEEAEEDEEPEAKTQ